MQYSYDKDDALVKETFRFTNANTKVEFSAA